MPPPPTYIEGWGEGQTYGPPWRNPFPGGWGYPWMGFEYPPGQPYGSWTSPPIPTFRKTSTLFWEPQRGQSFCSTSGAGSTISSSSGQVGLPRKKIRIEEVTDSDPQPESVSSSQASQPKQVGNVRAAGVGSTQVRRDESFAKLSRKAQLYETAKDRFQKCLIYHNQHFHETLSEADFIKKAEVKPTLETSEVSKRKRKNLARLERRKAKALAEQLMTAPVEASVPTVQPSATVLDDAEMAVVEAAISDSSVNLVEGLVEGHLYQLVGGRFIECELTQSGSVRACSSVPSTPLSTVVTREQPSYGEVVSIEKTILPASTGLEDDLAKLSTNTVETAENPEVDNIREDQREAVAGPGKGDRPDPKQAAKEKRKRKRQAAKAAAAATKAKAVVVASVVNNNDATMANVNEAMDKKDVVEDDSFTLVGPRRGRSVAKSSTLRRKTP